MHDLAWSDLGTVHPPTIGLVIPDGTYDVIVVDADESLDDGVISLHLAFASGPRRGEMITVDAHGLDRDPLDLLAVPATLTVEDATPQVHLEG